MKNCVIHDPDGIYPGVIMGEGCKIQKGALLFEGVVLGDYVFIGPNVTFTNVKHPCAWKKADKFETTTVGDCAVIGAGAVILPGITIGRNAVVGAGAVVTKNVMSYTTVAGNPAKEMK
jgi:acetyltransferase-like isoleucine patch superfamily enzyme